MNHASHPVWSLCRLMIYMIALFSTLYLYAEKFDATEVRTLVTMFIVASGVEGGTQIVRGLKHDKCSVTLEP